MHDAESPGLRRYRDLHAGAEQSGAKQRKRRYQRVKERRKEKKGEPLSTAFYSIFLNTSQISDRIFFIVQTCMTTKFQEIPNSQKNSDCSEETSPRPWHVGHAEFNEALARTPSSHVLTYEGIIKTSPAAEEKKEKRWFPPLSSSPCFFSPSHRFNGYSLLQCQKLSNRLHLNIHLLHAFFTHLRGTREGWQCDVTCLAGQDPDPLGHHE